MRIFIDPGHGGSDTGAVANGIIEKDINLIVAKEVKSLLEVLGIEILMSRTDDSYIGLSERCVMANNWEANYFVSIHHNAGGGDGYEVIHTIYTQYSEGDELAQAIGNEFAKTGQNLRRIFSRKGANGDYYAIIRETNMPAVITEFAFLDTSDFEAVDTHEELMREALAIVKGICSHIGKPYEENKTAELSVDEALQILTGKVIDSPDYWRQVAGVVNHFDKLLINMANYIKHKVN